MRAMLHARTASAGADQFTVGGGSLTGSGSSGRGIGTGLGGSVIGTGLSGSGGAGGLPGGGVVPGICSRYSIIES